MRYVVAGTGGVGAYVGGRLAAAGERVVFAGRPAVLDPIARGGLLVGELGESDGSHTVTTVGPGRFACVPSIAEAAREAGSGASGDGVVVLLAVKSHATARTAAEIAAAFSPGTLVVSLQNGVENVARIRAAAPLLDVAAAMVPYNIVWLASNHVHRATGGVLRLERTARTETLAAALARAGLEVQLSDDIRAVQWGKLLVNLNNPVNALSGLSLRDELAQRDYRRVWARLMREGLAALRAANIVPARVLAVPPQAMVRVLPLPDFAFRALAGRITRIDPTARSSMADDFARGRPTEIDDLCGAVVRLARAHGRGAPANETICAVVAAFDGTFVSGRTLSARVREPVTPYASM